MLLEFVFVCENDSGLFEAEIKIAFQLDETSTQKQECIVVLLCMNTMICITYLASTICYTRAP